jgi:hypothetical protein
VNGRADAKSLVLFLGNVLGIDMAGADMLIELEHGLSGRGIELRFAGLHGHVRDALLRAGMEPSHVHAYRTIPEALAG